MPAITVDGRRLEAGEDLRLLELLRREGIDIPALCHHPALSPAGACKLCAVEVIESDKPPQIKLACLLKPRQGLELRTDTEQVQRARTAAFRSLIQYAPESTVIRDLAARFDIDLGPAPDECIRCRLCIRACKEIVGADALKLEKRGSVSYVVPRQEDRCIGCATCVNLCPTGAISMEDSGDLRIISIRDEVIGRNPLIRCEACGRIFATHRFLDRVERRTEDHPHVKERHCYCPTCAKLMSTRVRSEARIKR